MGKNYVIGVELNHIRVFFVHVFIPFSLLSLDMESSSKKSLDMECVFHDSISDNVCQFIIDRILKEVFGYKTVGLQLSYL